MSRICSHCGYENMDDSLVRCDVCGEPLMPVYSSNQSGPSGGNNQQGVGFLEQIREFGLIKYQQYVQY